MRRPALCALGATGPDSLLPQSWSALGAALDRPNYRSAATGIVGRIMVRGGSRLRGTVLKMRSRQASCCAERAMAT